MSTHRIYDKVLQILETRAPQPLRRHLDIGSGSGRLIGRLQKNFQVESSACDYTDTLMKLPGVRVDVADLNVEKLPYPDGQFDLVTATEVVEHLEHYRETLREIHRVLRPGGVCIVSTPNVLSIKSRVRYLATGFANLFGPLPIRNTELYSTGGHINPVGCFYLMHSMFDAGFEEVEVCVDKLQRSGIWYLFWAAPLLFPMAAWSWRKEEKKFKTVTSGNRPLLRRINALDILLGRTILVTGVKPPAAASTPAAE